MKCEEILELAHSGKLEKDEIELFKDCFLDIRHLLRFKIAYSFSEKIAKVGIT